MAPQRRHYRGEIYARLFSVEPPDWSDAVQWEQYLMPRQVTALVRDARYPVKIEIDLAGGRPLCVGLRRLDERVRLDNGKVIERGPELTGALLRSLPLRMVMRDITSAVAHKIGKLSKRHLDPFGAEELVDAWLPVTATPGGLKRFQTEAFRPQRGRRLTDERLIAVADVYRRALHAGRPPTKRVAEAMHVARPTAGRWVMEARRRGFLPATEPRTARA
jgi:hypothetical protein